MQEKTITQTIKGYKVEYTKRMYYGANYYYLDVIDGIPIPFADPFPKKRYLIDFVNCYHETKDIKLSFELGFRPDGMTIKEAINLINKTA